MYLATWFFLGNVRDMLIDIIKEALDSAVKCVIYLTPPPSPGSQGALELRFRCLPISLFLAPFNQVDL